MAYFAELDENNIVLQVIVVGDDIPANGATLADNDLHIDGEKWCQNFFKGGVWKQTFNDGKFRKQKAGVGFKYDSEKDIFIANQPYASWTLDENDDWQPPVAEPTTGPDNDSLKYSPDWREDLQKWIYIGESDQAWLWDGTSWTQN